MNATEDAVRNVCYNGLNMHTSTAMGLIVREGRGGVMELGLPLNVTVTLGGTIGYGLFHHRRMHSLIHKT